MKQYAISRYKLFSFLHSYETIIKENHIIPFIDINDVTSDIQRNNNKLITPNNDKVFGWVLYSLL